MTRINCIPVTELVDKHLVAEYRELPRVLKLARHPKAGEVFPTEYTLGAGHVKFFYNKIDYIYERFTQLVLEMKRRGFKPQYDELPQYIFHLSLWNGWTPTAEAQRINRERIAERLKTMKGD